MSSRKTTERNSIVGGHSDRSPKISPMASAFRRDRAADELSLSACKSEYLAPMSCSRIGAVSAASSHPLRRYRQGASLLEPLSCQMRRRVRDLHLDGEHIPVSVSDSEKSKNLA